MSDKITFETNEVEGFKIKIGQFTGEIDGPLLLEEFVQLKVIAQVIDVGHRVNQNNGILYRNHILKVMDIDVEDEDA